MKPYTKIGANLRRAYRSIRPVPSTPDMSDSNVCDIELVPRDELIKSFQYALRQFPKHVKPAYVEFGVFNGLSITCMMEAARIEGIQNLRIIGLDSFEGLPDRVTQDDNGIWSPGQFTCSLDDALACIEGRGYNSDEIILEKCWYHSLSPERFAELLDDHIPIVIMIDCDAYSSAESALKILNPHLQGQHIIFFDDWRLHDVDLQDGGEFKAFREWLVTRPDLENKKIPAYSRKAEAVAISQAKNQTKAKPKLTGNQNDYRLRAFDLVDYILYSLAMINFWVLAYKGFIGNNYEYYASRLPRIGNIPNITDGEAVGGQAPLAQLLIFGFFLCFVTVVYLRNYVIMHSIDNRRGGYFPRYDFVSHNTGWHYNIERVLRALIVLWVLTTTVGVVPIVTSILSDFITTVTNKFTIPLWSTNLSPIDALMAYYGLVIVILFLLFVLYDVINVSAVQSQARKNKLTTTTDPNLWRKVVANKGVEVPIHLRSKPAAFSIIAYMGFKTSSQSEIQSGVNNLRRQKYSILLDNDRFVATYFLSRKFRERISGALIGILAFAAYLIPDDSQFSVLYLLAMSLLIFLYLRGTRADFFQIAIAFLTFIPRYLKAPPLGAATTDRND